VTLIKTIMLLVGCTRCLAASGRVFSVI